MPWARILDLLGPGFFWAKSKEEIERAIVQAERDGDTAAVGHLKGILKLRNEVQFEKAAPVRQDRG